MIVLCNVEPLCVYFKFESDMNVVQLRFSFSVLITTTVCDYQHERWKRWLYDNVNISLISLLQAPIPITPAVMEQSLPDF